MDENLQDIPQSLYNLTKKINLIVEQINVKVDKVLVNSCLPEDYTLEKLSGFQIKTESQYEYILNNKRVYITFDFKNDNLIKISFLALTSFGLTDLSYGRKVNLASIEIYKNYVFALIKSIASQKVTDKEINKFIKRIFYFKTSNKDYYDFGLIELNFDNKVFEAQSLYKRIDTLQIYMKLPTK